jgi:hypothetical protein
MKRITITPEFVEYVPHELAESVLYISITYRTSVHRCPCGCGNKVVTPISPADWQLYFDGESVSLTPSIGNWTFPCRSHYWIKANEIRWADVWDDERIVSNRMRDNLDRDRYFADRIANQRKPSAPGVQNGSGRRAWFRWLFRQSD